MDSLDRARARYPVGSRVTARVAHVPEPRGVVGVFLDAGYPPEGFVDVATLPLDPASWPRVGDESDFEVLQHRGDQMRLWPIDPAWRRPMDNSVDDQEWAAIKAALNVGDVVPARVVRVFSLNRECFLDLGLTTVTAEWSGVAPVVGEDQQVVVKALLDTTNRVLIDFV